MTTALKRIDLETFAVDRLPLDPAAKRVTVGRTVGADVVVPSPRVSRRHCAYVFEGGRWWLEDIGSAGGTWLNGERVTRAALEHGDTVNVGDVLLVFAATPEAHDAALEAAVGEAPQDAARVRVWADWLSEQGDPLGEELARALPGPAALEGLEPFIDAGVLELEWRHGLVVAARVRRPVVASSHAGEALARLLSLRVCRWIESLTVDAGRVQDPASGAASVLRALLSTQGLERLAHLSLGYLLEPAEPSHFLDELKARLPRRFPRLVTPPAAVLPAAGREWLEVLEVPPGVDFHAPGSPESRRLPLVDGLWVGTAQAGALRALAPGLHREGVMERFLIRHEAARCVLVPADAGVRLNGRPAVATRLLPGDVIEDPSGVRFRFGVD